MGIGMIQRRMRQQQVESAADVAVWCTRSRRAALIQAKTGRFNELVQAASKRRWLPLFFQPNLPKRCRAMLRLQGTTQQRTVKDEVAHGRTLSVVSGGGPLQLPRGWGSATAGLYSRP